MTLEGGRHRALDNRGGLRLHQPQHPDPFLVGLARVLGKLGPRRLPHRGQPPVEECRRLGHGAVLPLEQRQHVKRIDDLAPRTNARRCSATEPGRSGRPAQEPVESNRRCVRRCSI